MAGLFTKHTGFTDMEQEILLEEPVRVELNQLGLLRHLDVIALNDLAPNQGT